MKRYLLITIILLGSVSHVNSGWDPLNLSGGVEDLDNSLDKAISKFSENLNNSIALFDKSLSKFQSGNENSLTFFNQITKEWNSDFNTTLHEWNKSVKENVRQFLVTVKYNTLYSAFRLNIIRSLLSFLLGLILIGAAYCLLKGTTPRQLLNDKLGTRVLLASFFIGLFLSSIFILPPYFDLKNKVEEHKARYDRAYQHLNFTQMHEASEALYFFYDSDEYYRLNRKTDVLSKIFLNPFLVSSTTDREEILREIDELPIVDKDILIAREYLKLLYTTNKIDRFRATISCAHILDEHKLPSPFDHLAYDIMNNYFFDPLPNLITENIGSEFASKLSLFEQEMEVNNLMSLLNFANTNVQNYNHEHKHLNASNGLKRIIEFNKDYRKTHSVSANAFLDAVLFDSDKTKLASRLERINNQWTNIEESYGTTGKKEFRRYPCGQIHIA